MAWEKQPVIGIERRDGVDARGQDKRASNPCVWRQILYLVAVPFCRFNSTSEPVQRSGTSAGLSHGEGGTNLQMIKVLPQHQPQNECGPTSLFRSFPRTLDIREDVPKHQPEKLSLVLPLPQEGWS